jgi:uncharacterized damage-inducible protein DinB
MNKHDLVMTVTPLEGYAPNIGRLVSMMNYARATTQLAVQGLTQEQLETRVHGRNSIAALLEHFAAIEVVYQARTFENRWMNKEEYARWGAATDLGERVPEIIGKSLVDYFVQLEEVRAKTLTELSKRDDEWLMQEFTFPNGRIANHHWCWFHVFEDEINHRGQIRILKKQLEFEANK